jgi:lysozyme
MVNQATIDLIKRWEGCKLKSYKCPAGVWTVGYGLTTSAGFIEVGPDTEITQAEADWYLQQVVDKFASKIRPLITAPITENQFGAFVSLAYNIGVGGFAKSSALRRFNEGNVMEVPAAFRMWKKAGGKVSQGLINRREAEIKLFLTPAPITDEPKITPKQRESAAQSRTVQASVVQGASAIGGAVGALNALDGAAQIVALVGCILVVLLAVFILRERLKAWASGWR